MRAAVVLVALTVFPHIFTDDAYYLWARTFHLGFHHLPYRNFRWEYPPLTILPVLVSPLIHNPDGFAVYFGMFMAVCELWSLLLSARLAGDEARTLTAYWYVVGVPFGAIAYFRLDFLAVVCATLGLAAVAEQRRAVGATVAGFAAKLWPAVLAATLFVERRYRQVVEIGAGIAVLLGVWYVFSPSGFHTFLRFRQGTGFQIEGIVGSVALVAGAKATTASNTWIVEPGRWKWVDPASTLAWAVLVLVVVLVARRRGRYRVVDLTGAFVASLLLASRLLSPQFLSWLLPFAALAWAARERLVGALYAASVGITMLYLCYYEDLVNGSTFWAAAVVVRNVLLLVMTVRMFQRGLAPEPGTG